MAMDAHTQFLLQLLDKVGAPLTKALSAHPSNDATGQKDAATMASLLAESVKAALALSQSMNIKSDDGNADAIRVSLAAITGNLIADTYKQTGRLPTEADAQRMIKALQSVILFADNFAPAIEHAQRLKTLDGTPPFIDPVQVNLFSINAMLPAISAVSEFSFGVEATQLIQTASEKIANQAKRLQAKFSAGGSVMGEMILMQSLSQIYAGAHRAETQRLKTQGEGSNASSETVFALFDKQVAMVEALLGGLGGGQPATSGAGSSAVKPQVSAEIPEEAPAPPPINIAPPAPTAPPAAGGSPMSFFKKK